MKFEETVSWLKLPHCPRNQLEKGTILSTGYDIRAAEDKIIYPYWKLDEDKKYEYIKLCKLNEIEEDILKEIENFDLKEDINSFYIDKDEEGEECIYRKKYNLQLVKTGICLKAEALSWFGIYLRSSTNKIGGVNLANSVGVIDYDYRGPTDEIMISLTSYTEDFYLITRGERIAQLILKPYGNMYLNTVEKELDWEAEDRGGFGSTDLY
ncbi:hypothetical protein V6O07_01225 [Arthrospira platensis SPKY2]